MAGRVEAGASQAARKAGWPKRTPQPRPKRPPRVKKRTKGAARSHQHPELIGLGLVALGLFLATLLYARLERRLGRRLDRRRRSSALLGAAAYVVAARARRASAG